MNATATTQEVDLLWALLEFETITDDPQELELSQELWARVAFRNGLRKSQLPPDPPRLVA